MLPHVQPSMPDHFTCAFAQARVAKPAAAGVSHAKCSVGHIHIQCCMQNCTSADIHMSPTASLHGDARVSQGHASASAMPSAALSATRSWTASSSNLRSRNRYHWRAVSAGQPQARRPFKDGGGRGQRHGRRTHAAQTCSALCPRGNGVHTENRERVRERAAVSNAQKGTPGTCGRPLRC